MSSVLEPLVIKASAGTGKTFALSNRYLGLLLDGYPLAAILAATFTRKAASEIRQRIIERLVIASTNDEKLLQLKEQLGRKDLNSEQVLTGVKTLVKELSRLEISTLDSFLVKICSSFPGEFGIMPAWRILDATEIEELQRNAFQVLLKKLDVTDTQKLLNVVSVGKAKRSVKQGLFDRFLNLHEIFLEAQREKLPWFCKEFDNNIGLDPGYIEKLIEQLQHIELPVTKAGAPNKKWIEAVQALGERLKAGEYECILASTLFQNWADGKDFNRAPYPEPLSLLIPDIIQICSQQICTTINRQAEGIIFLLGQFDFELKKLKTRANGLTFSDVKQLFLEDQALTKNLEQVFYRIDSSIKHVLLDEFQDTSLKEWRGLEPIVDEILSKYGLDNSFFCVGDMKQAIYGWRGGVSQIFDHVLENWPQIKQQPLSKSYRSSQVIIDFVNQFFLALDSSSLLSSYPQILECWNNNYDKHCTELTEQPGLVRVRLSENKKDKLSGIKALTSDIEELLNVNTNINIAVLVRDNKQLLSIVRYLRNKFPSVSISDQGGNAFSQSQGVALVFSLLHVIDHPADSASVFHLANSALCNFLELEPGRAKVVPAKILDSLRLKINSHGLPDLIGQLLKLLTDNLSADDVMRLKQLHTLSFLYEGYDSLRPSEFINWAKTQQSNLAEQAQITVMTIHKSKGLEFDAVLLPDLSFNLLGSTNDYDVLKNNPLEPAQLIVPHKSQKVARFIPELAAADRSEKLRRLNESLCLLYVAFTRSKSALYIALHAKGSNASNAAQELLYDIIADISSTGDKLLELGQQEWYKNQSQKVCLEADNIYQPIDSVILRKSDSDRARAVVIEAASSLDKKRQTSFEELLTSQQNSVFERGIEIHRVFQELHWLENREEQISAIFSRLNTPAELIEEFKNILLHPEVAKIFSLEYYKEKGIKIEELYTEHRFLTEYQGQIVTGSIDRLIKGVDIDGNNYVEVIDFKSDRFDFNNQALVTSISDSYRSQLEVYAHAAANFYDTPITNIQKTLVFVSPGKVIAL